MKDEQIMELINKAKSIANKNFCCTHSKFTVGAALLASDGKVYTGFNVENCGIQSICAERVAFTKALSSLKNEFICIAVVGRDLESDMFKKCLPCGYCRQFMSEYASPKFIIYTYDDVENKIYKYKLGDLIPEVFMS